MGVVSLIDKRTCGAEPSFGVRYILTGRVQAGRTRLLDTRVEERVASKAQHKRAHTIYAFTDLPSVPSIRQFYKSKKGRGKG